MRRSLILSAFGALLVAGGCSADEPKVAERVAATEFTSDLPCGHGFAATDAEEQVLLRMTTSVPPTGDVELPGHWTAVIEVGERVAANWCADLILESEGVVEEMWQIIEGAIVFDGAPPADGFDPSSPVEVLATLTGGVAQGPGGDTVELGDIVLRNTLWGYYAG